MFDFQHLPFWMQITVAVFDLFRQWVILPFIFEGILGYWAEVDASKWHAGTPSLSRFCIAVGIWAATVLIYVFQTLPVMWMLGDLLGDNPGGIPFMAPPTDGFQFALLYPYLFVLLVASILALSNMIGRVIFHAIRSRYIQLGYQ